MMIDFKKDFPLIDNPKQHPFCYADSAASTQKPYKVIEAITDFYYRDYANVHRGAYRLAERASQRYEEAKKKIVELVSGDDKTQVVLTRSATESLNLLAFGLEPLLEAGDIVVLSVLEHHANLLPWQQLKKRRGIELKFIPINQEGVLDQGVAQTLLALPGVKVVSLLHTSNTLGTVQPLQEIFKLAQQSDIITIADCCQSFYHSHVSMTDLCTDAMVFSSHKMFGPSGIGALVIKTSLLERLGEFQTGGGIVQSVELQDSILQRGAARFEAGTPNIEGAIGFAAAIDYVAQFSFQDIQHHYDALVEHGMKMFSSLKGYQLLAPSNHHRAPIFSLYHPKIHPHDLATYLDTQGICVRAGHHCTMPLLKDLLSGHPTMRFSFSLYSSQEDISYCVSQLEKAREFFDVR